MSLYTFDDFERLNVILDDVRIELHGALTKFGSMASPHEGWAVIKEEVDELWEEVRANNGRNDPALDEATQIAAMAIRYILDLGPKPPAIAVRRVEVDLGDLAPLEKYEDQACPSCGGAGSLSEELVCCGQYLDSGECCTAVKGTSALVPQSVPEQCPECSGSGVVLVQV